MLNCIVARFAEVTINPIEYLLDSRGKLKTFSNPSKAKTYLKKHGYTNKDIEDYIIFEEYDNGK